MATPAAGSVVLIPFPFSDLSRSKLRPAIVLADVLRGDFIMCQVTSNAYGDPSAINLPNSAFREGSLSRDSYARPGKLFTANSDIVADIVGTLSQPSMVEIVAKIEEILTRGRI